MRIDEFEHNGVHVEIHSQQRWGAIEIKETSIVRHSLPTRFFWTTGASAERFYGPCDYFANVEDARMDAIREINLNLKELGESQ